MENNFSGDTACKALWRYEDDPGFLVNSMGGNDLVEIATVTQSATCKEGSQSADFNTANGEGFKITDANLPADFPLKNGDAVKKISICFWVQFDQVGDGSHRAYLYSKGGDEEARRSIRLSLDNADSYKFKAEIGTGAAWEVVAACAAAFTAGRWLHIAFTYQDSDKSYLLRIWDDTEGDYFMADITGTATNNIYVGTGCVGAPGYSDWGTAYTPYQDGRFDEFVVTNDILSTAEIDQIRLGTYGASTTVVSDTRGTWRGALRGHKRGMMKL